MLNTITVPEKITGILFPNYDIILSIISKDTKTLFQQSTNGWHIKKNYPSWKPEYRIYEGYLDPINGQLILGLDKIVKDCNSISGGIYTLTELDIEYNIGRNYVAIGKAKHPYIKKPSVVSHKISKRDLLKEGDKVVLLKQYRYQLLYEVAGDLVPVKGMVVIASSLNEKRALEILKVSYFTLDSILNNKNNHCQATAK